MKVVQAFFCRFEHKNYNVGDEYTGERTDLWRYLEEPKKVAKKENKKLPKVKLEKK
jgi:hypothetical protein